MTRYQELDRLHVELNLAEEESRQAFRYYMKTQSLDAKVFHNARDRWQVSCANVNRIAERIGTLCREVSRDRQHVAEDR